ncbi:MAG: HNH endonuclease [Candidatus Woesebacteria bacterium GW2011_GWB1_39_12]|uniref:HNH endonuclease n=1 Tax=Candidatus Woesebacteria bacterium GW2011_GWB1_39_12 TaxID=1618574 RepID=A0A0G0M6Y6_9BACT|nr:MAG: HNH endonuclease [Candidatus Woesebacteria bacterium GW2011_GWB1_39_12]
MSKGKMIHSEAGKLGAIASRDTIIKNKNERIASYNKNPKLCGNCKCKLPYDKRYNKYCSHSCSAQNNNKNRNFNTKKKYFTECFYCGKILDKKGKYCNKYCEHKQKEAEIDRKIESGEFSGEHPSPTIRKYLRRHRERKCEGCGLKIWQGHEIPLQVHHIDGIAKNNLPDNLMLLCCNCHALTGNFGSKNKGNGRSYRYKIQ